VQRVELAEDRVQSWPWICREATCCFPQRANIRSRCCVGLFTDNMVLFLPLTTEQLQRTPDLLVTSHHTRTSDSLSWLMKYFLLTHGVHLLQFCTGTSHGKNRGNFVKNDKYYRCRAKMKQKCLESSRKFTGDGLSN